MRDPEKRLASRKRYDASEKGRARHRNFNKSPKGRLRSFHYEAKRIVLWHDALTKRKVRVKLSDVDPEALKAFREKVDAERERRNAERKEMEKAIRAEAKAKIARGETLDASEFFDADGNLILPGGN